jgi:hypothetical protein
MTHPCWKGILHISKTNKPLTQYQCMRLLKYPFQDEELLCLNINVMVSLDFLSLAFHMFVSTFILLKVHITRV